MPKSHNADPDMLPEYDFSSAPRGRFHAKYRGMRYKGAVVLDPDVQRAFPDSVAVNEALRTLLRVGAGHSQQARSRRRKAG